MCFGSSPGTPPAPLPAPQQADASVTAASDAERKRKRALASNTVLTGPQGVTTPVALQGKTLLGS